MSFRVGVFALALLGACSGDDSARAPPVPADAASDTRRIQTNLHSAPNFDRNYGPPSPPAPAEDTPPLGRWPEPGGDPLPWDRMIDRLVVHKAERRLYAMIGDEAIKAYRIALGFAPEGHKAFAGDGRTPEGVYWIDRKNAYSQFHLSLGVSYPNVNDRRRARALGVSPGGDIMIHGFPDDDPLGFGINHPKDWTFGCVAVTNKEIEELWRAVPLGTPIHIEP